ncbi:hypothetical protein Dimus_002419 [Dionaea muscipula]
MGSYADGIMLDPDKCSKLTIDEKRRLVYEMFNRSHHSAAEMLQSWSRQELMQIVCVEAGKERKYTGLTKLKLIELLLKIVSEKKKKKMIGDIEHSPMAEHRASMRLRKSDHPSRTPVSGGNNVSMSYGDVDVGTGSGIYCRNSACKHSLSRGDEFCKRCSCCLCCKFDDNKDPSLWLTCSSDPPFQGRACNMSCHLECFLKRAASGIAKSTLQGAEFDGTFYCVSCGKVNDFLSCWRKQLVVAKETRRVDILCYRLGLCQKLLAGTTLYHKVCEIVVEAVKKLEADVGGPLTGLPMKKMGRGIVNRLSAGPQVQKLCGSAVEVLETIMYRTSLHHQLPGGGDPMNLPDYCKLVSPNMIRFEDACATSVTVVLGGPESDDKSLGRNNVGLGYSLWHHKVNNGDGERRGSAEPTSTLFPPETRFIISGLTPATEYAFKVVSFDSAKEELSSCEVRLTTRSGVCEGETANAKGGSSETETSQSPATNCSTLSNPSSVEDQDETYTMTKREDDDDYLDYYKNAENVVKDPALDNHKMDGQSVVVAKGNNENTVLPITPSRRIETKRRGRPRSRTRYPEDDDDGGFGKKSSSKESSRARDVECAGIGNGGGGGASSSSDEEEFGKYVKVIRWLEREGHFERSFRQRFLTWYTMRATSQDERVVKVFIDTLSDDPPLLAEQLIDTFTDVISSKRTALVPAGFCMKLWH